MTHCKHFCVGLAAAWLGALALPAAAQAQAVAAPGGAASGPAGQAEVRLQGAGPYHLLRLPLALRSAMGEAAPRMLNGKGDALPWAWVVPPQRSVKSKEVLATVFKLPPAPPLLPPGASGNAAAAKPVSPGWMIDLRQAGGALQKLELELAPGEQGVYSLQVEASDDLQQWRMVQPALQVVQLEVQGQQLASQTLDLGGVQASYLRLKTLPGSALPTLKSARVTALAEQWLSEPLQWTEPIEPLQCGAQHCDYALPANLPLDQVEVLPTEPNTLADAQILVRLEGPDASQRAAAANAEWHSRPHGLRGHIRALRHKSEPAPASAAASADDAAWMVLADAPVYWLKLPQGELRSGAVWLQGSPGKRLRLATSGPLSLLGTQPPTIKLGVRARSLVFLARGAEPWRLAWGDETSPPAPSAAMGLAQLMPGRKPGDALPADTASVNYVPPPPRKPQPVPPSMATASSAAPSASTVDNRKPWLWGVLLIGLALMGAMAWSLLRKKPAAH
jgi:hypothetical protein